MDNVVSYVVAFGTLIGIAVGILFGARSSSREAARLRQDDTDRKIKAAVDPLMKANDEKDHTIEWMRDRISSLEDQLRGGLGDERLNRPPRPR